MHNVFSFSEKEFNFEIALSLLILALSSLSVFVFTLFCHSFDLFTVLSFFCFSLSAMAIILNKNLLHLLLRPVALFLLKTFFFIDLEGQENIPEEGGVILAGNHTGLLDSLIISVACKRPVNFIMTNEVFSWPFAGKIVSFFNVIPVVPGKGMDALKEGIRKLEEGKVVVIFPEGRCTEDGKLNRFHRGVARLQSKSQAQLVPFAIEGGFEAWPIAGLPSPHKVIVQLGQVIQTESLKEKEITDEVKARVQFMKDALERRVRLANEKELQTSVLSLLQAQSDRYASQQALFTADNNDSSMLTYSELSRRARNLANQLIIHGIKPGDRIAILSESRPEWGLLFFAAIRAGATIVPLDIKLTSTELISILTDCQPSALFVSRKFHQSALELQQLNTSLQNLYSIDPLNEFKEFHSIMECSETKEHNVERNIDDTALIIYTSGTTGNPKGVKLSFDNLISQLYDIQKAFALDSSDTLLSVLPLNHTLELTCGFLNPLHSGAKVVYANKFSPAHLTSLMAEKQVTYMITVPLMLKMLKRSLEKELNKSSIIKRFIFSVLFKVAFILPSMQLRKMIFKNINRKFGFLFKGFICGGAPLDRETEVFFYTIGIPVYQGYGLTETSPVISINTPKCHKIASVGKVLSSVTVRLTDQGEIIVKGANVMQGYYNRADLTAEVVDSDGWFHTGDIGHIDKEGFLFITGRLKNLIVLGGGKKVFPEEVETVLLKSEIVDEVCVTSYIANSGSKNGSEEVCAVIVLEENFIKRNNENLTKEMENELQPYLLSLAAYKRPAKLIISYNELPKTSTRKLKRKEIALIARKKSF
jgi:long-chain acyl-CoA synthetase